MKNCNKRWKKVRKIQSGRLLIRKLIKKSIGRKISEYLSGLKWYFLVVWRLWFSRRSFKTKLITVKEGAVLQLSRNSFFGIFTLFYLTIWFSNMFSNKFQVKICGCFKPIKHVDVELFSIAFCHLYLFFLNYNKGDMIYFKEEEMKTYM